MFIAALFLIAWTGNNSDDITRRIDCGIFNSQYSAIQYSIVQQLEEMN